MMFDSAFKEGTSIYWVLAYTFSVPTNFVEALFLKKVEKNEVIMFL